MKKYPFIKLALIISIVALISISCESAPRTEISGFSARAFDLVQNAVFEIVQLKPDEDSTVYEGEIDWSVIPFNIRNDPYNSIGTAFAISETELITAFHVVNLWLESLVFDRYFIRNQAGEVFELDQVVAGCNERDFLIFTVKDKTFDHFFQFETNFREGDEVFSVGNALGQGIIIRNGLILGTIPEEDSGRWDLLKTSADGNPGNSGGPLVNSDGKVVALVISRQDNILYSTPASVILDTDRSTLDYRLKLSYLHFILANRINRTFETQVILPQHYTSVRSQLIEAYELDYVMAMNELFDEAPDYLNGPNNMYILSSVLSSVFPQIDFIDPNDDQWTLTNLSTRSYSTADGRNLMHVNLSDWDFYKISKPDSMSLLETYDPLFVMDTILQSIRLNRSVGSNNYRINSFGNPMEVSSYTDFRGREWITATWLLEFADQVVIMYILPLPNGPAVISTRKPSSFLHMYEWDLRKICDHIWAGYSGTFYDWNEFLSTSFVPPFLSDFNFLWQPDTSHVSFNANLISMNLSPNVFEWTGNSELYVAPGPYISNNTLYYGIRRIVLNRNLRRNDFITMVLFSRPDTRLPNSYHDTWDNIANEGFPFNRRPVVSERDNEGIMGGSLPLPSDQNLRYSIYMAMENPESEDNVQRRFNALLNGIRIR